MLCETSQNLCICVEITTLLKQHLLKIHRNNPTNYFYKSSIACGFVPKITLPQEYVIPQVH